MSDKMTGIVFIVMLACIIMSFHSCSNSQNDNAWEKNEDDVAKVIQPYDDNGKPIDPNSKAKQLNPSELHQIQESKQQLRYAFYWAAAAVFCMGLLAKHGFVGGLFGFVALLIVIASLGVG